MTVEQKAHSYASSHEIDVPQLFHYLYNAFLAGASSVEVGGCRWVKCSERMPKELLKNYYCKVYEHKFDKEFKKTMLLTLDEEWQTGDDEMVREWLDESPSSSEAVPLTIDDLEYVISEFVCTYAPHHSQIESPRMFVNRSLANRKKNHKNVEAVGDDAVAFAEWAAKNDWFYDIDDKDWFNGEGEDQVVMTGEQLYQLFKQRK